MSTIQHETLEVPFILKLFCSSLCMPLLPTLSTLYDYEKTKSINSKTIHESDMPSAANTN